MSIHRTTQISIVAGAVALLLAGCAGQGPPSDSLGGEAGPNGDGGTGASAAVASWQPCDVVGDSITAIATQLHYVEFDGEPMSAPVGTGMPEDMAKCSVTTTYWVNPDLESITASGLTFIAVGAEADEVAAQQRYESLLSAVRDPFGSEAYADEELAGPWDEGVVIHGDYGIGDTFVVVVRDGNIMIELLVETDSALTEGGRSGSPNPNLDAASVRQYLQETAIIELHDTVFTQLEADGVTAS